MPHDVPTVLDAAPLGRRERKKAQTRTALEESAIQLFRDRGYAETTIEDITEAADVSPRTFFRYFESKESVLFSSSDAALVVLRRELDARPEGEGAMQGIRRAFQAVAAVQTEDPRLTLVRALISLEAPEVQARSAVAGQQWEAVLVAWLQDRFTDSMRSDTHLRMLAASAVAALRVGVGRWVETGGRGDAGTMVDEALDVLRTGLDV